MKLPKNKKYSKREKMGNPVTFDKYCTDFIAPLDKYQHSFHVQAFNIDCLTMLGLFIDSSSVLFIEHLHFFCYVFFLVYTVINRTAF